MKTKLRALLALERAINFMTKPLRLRVLLVPDSSLHHRELRFRTDGVLTSHHCNFQDDPRFAEVLAEVNRFTKPNYHEYRVYVALELMRQAAQVPNSIFVECGVGEGALALIALKYLRVKNPFIGVDTFNGIDPTLATAEEKRLWGDAEAYSKALVNRSYSSNSYEEVTGRFSAYRNARFIKGSVPRVLIDNLDIFQNISFLHIDMNSSVPEREAVHILYDRVTAPGFILFDDYGFEDLSHQRRAVDEACATLGIAKPMTLPTGQGLIIKSAHRLRASVSPRAITVEI